MKAMIPTSGQPWSSSGTRGNTTADPSFAAAAGAPRGSMPSKSVRRFWDLDTLLDLVTISVPVFASAAIATEPGNPWPLLTGLGQGLWLLAWSWSLGETRPPGRPNPLRVASARRAIPRWLRPVVGPASMLLLTVFFLVFSHLLAALMTGTWREPAEVVIPVNVELGTRNSELGTSLAPDSVAPAATSGQPALLSPLPQSTPNPTDAERTPPGASADVSQLPLPAGAPAADLGDDEGRVSNFE